MNLLGIGLGFLGYVLVYAAVANHGRFATSPWAGLVADAYTGEHVTLPAPASSSSPSSFTPSPHSLQPNTITT